jgi:flagellar basal body-associated protein FliL
MPEYHNSTKHVFRHHEYMHIKPVLIISLILIIVISIAALVIYFYQTSKTNQDDKDN